MSPGDNGEAGRVKYRPDSPGGNFGRTLVYDVTSHRYCAELLCITDADYMYSDAKIIIF